MADNRSMQPPNNYTVERNEFLRWLELAESTRIKLNKTVVCFFGFFRIFT